MMLGATGNGADATVALAQAAACLEGSSGVTG